MSFIRTTSAVRTHNATKPGASGNFLLAYSTSVKVKIRAAARKYPLLPWNVTNHYFGYALRTYDSLPSKIPKYGIRSLHF